MGQESEELPKAADNLVQSISEYSTEIDRECRLPQPLVSQLKDAGFFRMMLGKEFGGLGVDPVTAARVVERLSAANASVGWVIMILSATSYWASALLSDAAAEEIFLSGDEISMAGTLVPTGKAVKTDGGWELSGRWSFASGCLHADWIGTASILHEGDEPIINDDGSPMARLLLTPASDCEIVENWDTTGLRGTGSHDYVMDRVFVPDWFVLQHPLQATPVRPGPRYAYPVMVVLMMAAVSMGTAQRALDGLVQLLGEKIDRRSGRPASDDVDKQAALGSAEALVGSLKSYLYGTLEQVWQTLERGESLSHELRGRFRIACTNAVVSSVKAVDQAYAAAGATSIYRTSNLERQFRDVHTAAAHAFMRPATLVDGGKLLLGREPALRTF